MVVHVDAPVLADPDAPGQSVLEDGVHVPAGTCQRLACDASRVEMRHDADGRVLEVGRRTRTISPALRLALLHRDRGCRFPGCGLRFCQDHHLRHWAHGGPTRSTTLPCSVAATTARSTRRASRWSVTQTALQFQRPDGPPIPEVPPPVAVPADPAGALWARHRAQGLALHAARSLTPSWLGERLNLGWALDVLHPLANPVATRGG